ncbi:MAG: sulfur carrier protein ThiS [Leptonema sp. (in: bacteria)]
MLVNGDFVAISELQKPTIEALLKKYNIKNTMLAVEVNGKVISKTQWDKEILKEEDKVELIRFVGGG